MLCRGSLDYAFNTKTEMSAPRGAHRVGRFLGCLGNWGGRAGLGKRGGRGGGGRGWGARGVCNRCAINCRSPLPVVYKLNSMAITAVGFWFESRTERNFLLGTRHSSSLNAVHVEQIPRRKTTSACRHNSTTVHERAGDLTLRAIEVPGMNRSGWRGCFFFGALTK